MFAGKRSPLHDGAVRRFFLSFQTFALLCIAQSAWAADGIVTGCDFKTGKIDPSCLNTVIANAIEVVFSFAGALCLLNIIIAGYQIGIGNLTGQGDTGGKNRLQWALVGFFITATCFGIISAIVNTATS